MACCPENLQLLTRRHAACRPANKRRVGLPKGVDTKALSTGTEGAIGKVGGETDARKSPSTFCPSLRIPFVLIGVDAIFQFNVWPTKPATGQSDGTFLGPAKRNQVDRLSRKGLRQIPPRPRYSGCFFHPDR